MISMKVDVEMGISFNNKANNVDNSITNNLSNDISNKNIVVDNASKKKYNKVLGRKNILQMVCVVLSMGILLCGCGRREQYEDANTVKIYYVSNEETKISSYEYVLQSQSVDDQLAEVVAQMSELPEKLNYKSLLTFGFEINRYRVRNGQLSLDVSENYKQLSPTTEILVRAGLVRNFTQIEGVDSVIMTVNGESLLDSLGALVGVMNEDTFIDNDGKQINSYEKVKLKLYYANEEGNKLISVNRTINYNSNVPVERLVVEELISGISLEDVYPVMNQSAKVVSINTQDGTCYVNFDGGFFNQIYNVTPEVTVYAIANSLVELANINKVQILVNGSSDIMYMETMNLNNFYERNLELVE